MRRWIAMVLVIVAYASTYLFTYWPEADENTPQYPFFEIVPKALGIDRFVSHDQTLTIRTYVYYIGQHLRWIFFTGALYMLSYYITIPQFKAFFLILHGLEVTDLVDFLLHYNERWFYFLNFSVEFGDIKHTLIAMAIINIFIQWAIQYVRRSNMD